ncbi:U7 snRNA-associated Sm-like protein LSm11 [Asbolus verrucosus]|uniref:U7 snRNA-associated Sm-like protein LSm11 n=1 Tax=Asbolus verrucosus TaxID=1661398 RepID=A0A482VYP4_ASBVE|nr:U7 snRNA-associated Sm-like protein LSm11 [Asbolus verrucosus]
MAAEETSDVRDDKKSPENQEYNPKLDFFSEHFDPLLALKTPNVVVPVPNAKTYDNIHIYKSAQEVRPQREPKKKAQVAQDAPIERRWLPHQLPTKTRKKINQKNVFTKMERVEGPLQFLKICKDKRHRIKVISLDFK